MTNGGAGGYPLYVLSPRTAAWIVEEAACLEKLINDEIAARWPKHCDLTHDALVQSVADKYLNALWSYQMLEMVCFGERKTITVQITAYNGEVDESV